jgi:two-component system, OmpR family, phosphate regulon sensor histidine kinase PhoR
VVNERQLRALLADSEQPIVVRGADGNVVAASAGALESPDVLTLYVDEPPTAYQELRAGFTASVSHELRTPLARLLALLESVELPDADVAELVERARREIDQIRALIDDVLFLGELETGASVVALGATQAMPVLEEVVADVAESAERAGVAVRVGGNRNVELPLRPRMLRVIVENLVENALRYAGPGSTLRLELEQIDGDVTLTAADDGAGVSGDDLPRLFERFFRADRARASRGTGLGLAIVKHIVTSAGGSVDARAGAGGGLEIRATFRAS